MIRNNQTIALRLSWSPRSQIKVMLMLVLIGASFVATAAEPADESPRVSITRQGPAVARDTGAFSESTRNEFPALKKAGQVGVDKRSATQSKSTSGNSESSSYDFWFYGADVELFLDQDGDGFFYGVDLWFDADTYYEAVDVYAVVYLSYEGGPWNEYSATDDFTIYGASGDDDYVIVTELVSGYPTGSYDLLVELFDAYDGSFLASIGPADTPELAFLPLEDSYADTPLPPVQQVVVVENGGGATGAVMLLMLGLAGLVRNRESLLPVNGQKN